MNFWTLLLAVVGAIQAIGLFAFLLGILRAPAGFQDEAGFHLTTEADIVDLSTDSGEDTLPPFGRAA